MAWRISVHFDDFFYHISHIANTWAHSMSLIPPRTLVMIHFVSYALSCLLSHVRSSKSLLETHKTLTFEWCIYIWYVSIAKERKIKRRWRWRRRSGNVENETSISTFFWFQSAYRKRAPFKVLIGVHLFMKKKKEYVHICYMRICVPSISNQNQTISHFCTWYVPQKTAH